MKSLWFLDDNIHGYWINLYNYMCAVKGIQRLIANSKTNLMWLEENVVELSLSILDKYNEFGTWKK